MQQFFLIFSMLGFLVSSPVLGAESYSLQKAVEDALGFDSRVLAQESYLNISKEGVNQAKGLMRATISGIGELEFQASKTLNPFGTSQQDGTRTTAGIQLEQPIFTFGRQTAKEKSAVAEVTRASQLLTQTKSKVAIETIDAFLGVLLIGKELSIFKIHTEALKELLEATEAKFQSNLTTQTDVLLVRSRYQQSIAQFTSGNASLNIFRNRLFSLTGKDFSTLKPADHPAFRKINLTLDKALSFAGLNVSALMIAEAKVKIAKAEVDFEKSELYPNVSIKGQFTRGYLSKQPTGFEGIGLSINVPLYNGGIQRSRSRASKHRLSQTQRQATFTNLQVRQKITASWFQVNGAKDALQAWEIALTAELKSLEGIKEEVDEGLRPITYLLEAQDQGVEVQIKTARAGKDLILSNFKFIHEAGLLLHKLAEIK